MAGAAQRTAEAKADVVTSLAGVLERWQVKPRRHRRWLRDVTSAFEQNERGAYLGYQRVSALAVDIARLAGLSPWSQAAIRASAFLTSLGRVGADAELVPRKGWDGEVRRWRWVQACMPTVEAVSPARYGGRARSRRAKEMPAEASVLSLAREFDQLTVEESGVPRMRTRDALQALRADEGQPFDGELVDLLWSEAGQAVCDNFLRHRISLQEGAEALLERSVQLLEKEASPAPAPSPRENPARSRAAGGRAGASSGGGSAGRRAQNDGVPGEKKTPDDKVVAAGDAGHSNVSPEGQSRRDEADDRDVAAEEAVEERSREMTKSGTKEEKTEGETASATAPAEEASSGGPGTLHLQLAAVVRDLEEIRSNADRGLRTLASVAPAVEELSTLISQLQQSFLRLQDGGSAPAPAKKEAERPRTLSLRVERADGSLDVDEVTSTLDNIRDLTDISVQERKPSWAVLQASICSEVDPSILEAKVAGSLTRHLGGDGTSIEVSFV